ncbi:MAG: hypothetical protein K2W81_10215 [Sphingomonas sp.]|uniref:hypothetical protein n=1 Tax=Sphingomonas sp. TaxID=28214 RepID=UPI0025EE4B95|nr:hypothetical protein [Sphingomonas sp.]MBY0284324.1 hypothetical protein [Sphingomonas sp.]
MCEDVARLVKGVPQKPNARYREDISFSQQFEQGLVHIVADFQIEGECHPLRVWIANRPQTADRCQAHDLSIEVFDEDNKRAHSRVLIADMAIENVEGINKGWMGRGVFQSFVSNRVLEISPPFWWPTGRESIDASVHRCQCTKNGLDDGTAPGHEVFRHVTSADTLTILQNLRWTVHPGGFLVEPSQNSVKLLDALIGPL